MKHLKYSVLSLLAAAAMMFSFASCGNSDSSSQAAQTQPSSSVTESTPTESTTETPDSKAGFQVDGTKLLDANGNEFVFRGINHAHTWFKDMDDIALEAIAATGANSVRLVLANGGQWEKDSLENIRKLIEKCKELKMVAILEVHDATGMDDLDSFNAVVDYWLEMKDALIGNEDCVILNIANEWIGSWKSGTWAKGYTAAIPKLREAGIKNLIMVDSAGWGQYPKCIKEKGMEVFNSDPLKNTMFSVHMYGSAGGSAKQIEENLTYATSQNLCVCVGEFGYNHSDGDVDEAFIMKYCTENNIGYLGWSWKGNGGGVEYLDIAKEWDGSVLSSDWGENLINGENGIKATSKICSIFE